MRTMNVESIWIEHTNEFRRAFLLTSVADFIHSDKEIFAEILAEAIQISH